MKTIPDLTRAHIDTLAALKDDPIAFSHASEVIRQRIALRLQQEPSISILTLAYAQALSDTLKTIPRGLHIPVIQSCLSEVLISWEDIHAAFGAQLQAKTPKV